MTTSGDTTSSGWDSGGQERLSQWRETQRKREHEQAMTAQA
jgi:hypothetical protein